MFSPASIDAFAWTTRSKPEELYFLKVPNVLRHLSWAVSHQDEVYHFSAVICKFSPCSVPGGYSLWRVNLLDLPDI
jgi:hypothetical protein